MLTALLAAYLLTASGNALPANGAMTSPPAAPGAPPAAPGPRVGWCRTHEIWRTKGIAGYRIGRDDCPIMGDCDVPYVRDGHTVLEDTLFQTISVHLHIFREDDGSNPAATPEQVAAAIQELNDDYAPWRIHFVCTWAYVDDSQFRTGSHPDLIYEMKATYAVSPSTTLNVYVMNLGYAYGTFAWDPEALTAQGGIVITDNFFTVTPHTLTHEFGHCLGLWHTHHGVSEVEQCGSCYEIPESLSDVTGDFCADTPPTPVSYYCGPPGGNDPCSSLSWGATQPENYMSYGGLDEECWSLFTAHQAARKHCWIDAELSSLLACTSEEDCNENYIPDECELIAGLASDCNENGIIDECDIAAGTSPDWDWNGVPDECEDCNGNDIPDGCDIDCGAGDCASFPLGCGGSVDCQPNGIPDTCDIASGASWDHNANGVPDECEIITWYVDDDGPNDPGPGDPDVSDPEEIGSEEHPFDSIQEVIALALAGDEIVLAAGTYTGEGNRDVDFLGRAITVRGMDPEDPDVVAATVIDCQGSEAEPHRAFSFVNGEGPDSIIAGLTIVHGWAPLVFLPAPVGMWWPEGGAVLCPDTSPTIEHCVFRHNHAASGAAIGSYDAGSPTIRHCTFVENELHKYPDDEGVLAGGYGGAIECSAGNPVIEDCVFLDNSCELAAGGAIYLGNAGVLLVGCTFEGNSAGDGWGGAVAVEGTLGILADCRFVDNSAAQHGGGIDCQSSFLELSRCRINGNAAWGAGATGGGLCIDAALGWFGSDVVMEDSETCGNLAGLGGGIWTRDSAWIEFVNCTLTENRAVAGDALGLSEDGAIVQFTNSIIWNGDGWLEPPGATVYATYTDVFSGLSGTGNIAADPLFAWPGSWDDGGTPGDLSDDTWTAGIYRVRPDSPCIDAGDPAYTPGPDAVDLAGEPRVADGDDDEVAIVDMGAYERQPATPGDCNCDGGVDFFDIDPFVMVLVFPAQFEAMYPDCNRFNADCNLDGLVDFFDLDPFVALITGK